VLAFPVASEYDWPEYWNDDKGAGVAATQAWWQSQWTDSTSECPQCKWRRASGEKSVWCFYSLVINHGHKLEFSCQGAVFDVEAWVFGLA
jgi:hypothetical protein